MVDKLSSLAIEFLVLTWFFVTLRCGVRVFIVRSFGVDDYLMLLSVVLFTIWGIFLLLGAHAGMGHHMASLSPAQIRLAMKYWLICGSLYGITATMVKIAVGCYLLRVIVSPVQRYVIWGTLLVSTGYGMFIFFGTIFQCSPVSYFYDTSSDGNCNGRSGGAFTGYIQAAINAATDFILAFIPYFMLRHSTMGWRKKAAIYLIMSLGSLGAVSTLIRIKTLDDLTRDADYLFNITNLAVWSWIEPGLGIIAGSMATLRPLVRICCERSALYNKTGSRSHSTNHARFDPEVQLDDLRGERGTTTANVEARESASIAPMRRGSERHSGEVSDWQSFGSEERLQDEARIKRSVKVTVETADVSMSSGSRE